jgi:hypothetical protein
MDGDLVDKHVVVVLVDAHEVVAEDREVVAEVDEKARRLFFNSLWQDVCVYWLWCRSERCSLLRTPRFRLVAIA